MAETYPPANQILSALGIEVSWKQDGSLDARSLVDLEHLGVKGLAPGMGAIVPIVDIVAGTAAGTHVQRDWLATSDVWIYERAPFDSPGFLEVETRLLRAGKRSVVMAFEVSSSGEGGATGTIEFSRIRREATSASTADTRSAGEAVRIGHGPLLTESLVDACGILVVDGPGGVAELARSPFVHNSIDTLQGGSVALLADVAAAAVCGPGARVVELQYRFLAQTGAGPARTSGKMVRSRNGDPAKKGPDSEATVVVEVEDSADSTLVGWASANVMF